MNSHINDFHSDRYKPLEKIGQGGVGSVYKARDTQLKRIVAIKIVSIDAPEKFVHRFQIEARANAQLDHPNIVKIYDFGQLEDGKIFIAMEYLDGISLSDRIKKTEGSGVTLKEAISILFQISRALETSHQKGVIHRDIKPSNVMLVKDENSKPICKVLDFGTAKLKDNEEQQLTRTGAALGTPAYMSPEAVKGKKPDTASDVYSFGCLAFELLSGKLLFQGDSKIETMAMHAEQAPPSLKTACTQEIPDNVEKLVMQCLEKETSRRPNSFLQISEELELIETEIVSSNKSVDSHKKENGDRENMTTNVLIVSILSILLVGALAYLGHIIHEGIAGAKDVKVKELKAEQTYNMFVKLKDFKPKLEPRLQKGSFIVAGNVDQDRESLKFLKGRKDIKELILDLNNLKGDTLQYVSELNLESLNLFASDIDDTTLEYVGRIKSLKTLNLYGCVGNTNNGYAYLSNLEKIEILDLGQTAVNTKGLKNLTSMKSLKILKLAQCPNVSEKSLPTLAKFAYLNTLAITHSNLENCDLSNLSLLKTLKELSLSKIPPNFATIVQNLNLEVLSIYENSNIKYDTIAKIAESKSLKLFSLINCLNVSDKIIEEIDSKHPNLRIEKKIMQDGLLSRLSGAKENNNEFWTDTTGTRATMEGLRLRHSRGKQKHPVDNRRP